MSTVTDGRLHRLALHLASERDIRRRVRAWRRRRWVQALPLLAVAALGALLTSWAQRRAR